MQFSSLLLFTNSVQVGGMEEHVRLIAQELGDSFEVSVVMPDWEETNGFAETLGELADDFEFITVDRRRGVYKHFSEAFRLARYARSRGIDVAHLHSTTYEGGTLALLALRAVGVKRIFLSEHLAPEHRPSLYRRLRRRVVDSLVTGVVSVSARNRESRMRHLGGSLPKQLVVENGIDVSRFDTQTTPDERSELKRKFQIPPDSEIVGSAIRLEPGKGVADLIDALVLIRKERPKAHLLIVGDGSIRADLEAQVDRLGIAEHVTMTGFLSEPHPLMELMDVFVVPVPFGSASIGLLEAMSMSKACVISFGGEGEAVVPGESGYWATPNEASSIAEHVCRLLRDPDHRQEIEQAARVRVEQHFSAAAMARELSGHYRGA